jgi:NADPH2:quinone reductase
MKCVVIRGYGREIDNLVLTEREAPEAIGEQIRVRVSAVAVNRADLLQRRGLYPAPEGVPPDIPGLEFVGYVDQVGEAVTLWRGGERVFGVVAGGAYARYLVTHQRLAVRVPGALTDIEAAAVPEAFISAYDALVHQGGAKRGDVLLVHAVAGGIGSAAVQIGGLLGAVVLGTSTSVEKLERLKHYVDFCPVHAGEGRFQTQIEERFGPSSVHVILDTVGARYWEQNLAVLAPRGTLVVFGLLGGATVETPLGLVLFKRLRIIGTALRGRSLEEKICLTEEFGREIVPWLESGRLRPVVDSVFPFDRVREATERMERNENVGKIVLDLEERERPCAGSAG